MLNPFICNKLVRLSQFICFLIFAIVVFNSQAFAANLNNIHNQINQSKQAKSKIQKQQIQLEKELQESEQAIADASLKINQTQNTISQARAALIELQQSSKQLEENKITQQSLLQQQLTSAYMTGQNDLLKLLLNQEDLSKVSRAKGYYHYLNEARLESIEALDTTQQNLLKNQQQQTQTLKNLEKLYQQQKNTQQTVSAEKDKRNKTLQALQQDINYQNNKIAELNKSEKALKARLRKASQARKAKELAAAKAKAAQERKRQAQVAAQAKIIAKNQSLSKFASQKGKLKWPIDGKVLHRFGTSRSSQVKWKGIAIAANEGEKVRAAATGRVLFAGYFKGYGMVIALDHNDNYITLYGYNQTLLQKAGDVVLQGDAIALAGHSGGQDKNSLYFELSHSGTAQNPLPWLSKR